MKKVFVIIICILGAFLLIKALIKDDTSEKVWVGNRVSASFPERTINETSTCPNLTKIFIDASGSMKPYFRADENGMINTLSEIKNLNIDNTNIYFLGSAKAYTGYITNILGEINKQPNLSATTFHDFFNESACRLDSVNELIYLVTDGIMSVGSGNTAKALVQLRGQITNSLKCHSNLAAAIFRYEGGYNGDYWNSKNQKITANECPLLKGEIKRPYYVIALGRKEVIRWMYSLPISKLNNPSASLYMGIHDVKGHMASALALGDSIAIEDMNQKVTLILELPDCLKDIEANIVKVCNAGETLNIPVKKEGRVLSAQILPTVPLRSESDGRIKISFVCKNEIPENWVNSWNTENDLNGPDEFTTYGLKYLIEGMFNGLENSENIFVVDFVYKRQ